MRLAESCGKVKRRQRDEFHQVRLSIVHKARPRKGKAQDQQSGVPTQLYRIRATIHDETYFHGGLSSLKD